MSVSQSTVTNGVGPARAQQGKEAPCEQNAHHSVGEH